MAEITEYESFQHRIRVLFWPQASPAELTELVGEDNISVLPDYRVQVRNGEGEWFTLGTGWAVSVDTDGYRLLMTPGALSSGYRPV
jgi:hypothetical protein